MTRSYTLYTRYSQEQLAAMQAEICAPYVGSVNRYSRVGNTPTPNGIYLHPRKVRDKLDAIAQAITWHMQNARKQAS